MRNHMNTNARNNFIEAYLFCVCNFIRVYICGLVEERKKFICFAHHKEMLEGLSCALDAMNCK